ncbi:glycosyltransferase family 2 protein [Elongatibacter sediminis]|uniref:Glycosyltransferase family 2 protein n=1 Tax=Elongatibacter sediminis TaxID=3119006 RepID=A0AAW9RMJ4_9GAMM
MNPEAASPRLPLSLVITTRDNRATLERCVRSVPFADEVLVLDSLSTDGTDSLAESLGARVVREAFRGFGPQKQRAIGLARHDQVLLLDADEALSDELAAEINTLLQAATELPPCRLRREEWLYWRWPRAGTRLTDHLRLFDRRTVRMSDHPVHAAPRTDRPTRLLRGRLRHHGHADIGGQLRRIDVYTSGAAHWRAGPAWLEGLRMILAPPVAFLREYVWRRQFLNGWAGYIAARLAATHAFLRHARRLEGKRRTPKSGSE